MLAADHQREVGFGGERPDDVLAVGGGVADVFLGRGDAPGKLLLDGVDDDVGVVDAEGGLGEVDQPLALGEVELFDVLGRFDDGGDVGGLAEGALDLLVVAVAHQEDVLAHLGVAAGLDVDLGHQRAGRVDRAEVAGLGRGADLGGDAVGTKDHRVAGGDVVDVFDKRDALVDEAVDHVLVVDDVVVDIQRGADQVDQLLDRVDGHVDAGAEAAGVGEDDPHGGDCKRQGCSGPATRLFWKPRIRVEV